MIGLVCCWQRSLITYLVSDLSVVKVLSFQFRGSIVLKEFVSRGRIIEWNSLLDSVNLIMGSSTLLNHYQVEDLLKQTLH